MSEYTPEDEYKVDGEGNNQPDDTVLSEVKGLRADVRDLTAAVREERAGRIKSDNAFIASTKAYRSSRRSMAVALGVVVIGASLWVNSVIQDSKQSCSDRIQARVDIRAMGVALADGTADVLEADEATRQQVHDRAVQTGEETLPPPNC